MTTSEDIPMT